MPSFILQDLQTCISALHYEHQNMLTSQYQKTVAYKTFHAFGVTFDPHARQWDVCCHHLKTTNHLFICALLNQNQMIYLNEIQEQLLSHCGVKASITTLFHTLWQLHFTYKDVSGKALEHNGWDQVIFMNWITKLVPDPDMLNISDVLSRVGPRSLGLSWVLVSMSLLRSQARLRPK
jgi:hypothetical protein